MSKATAKVVLITGASSGFGLSTTLALARHDHRVIATMRDLNRQDRLMEAATNEHTEANIDVMCLDVTDAAAIQSVVDEVLKRHGRIDALINNAGFAAGGFVEDISLTKWREQFETNFFGALAMIQAVLPHMREHRRGTIINVSSVSGRFGFPGMGPYSASKHALEGLSESLRLEMAPYGVRVVLIEPASYKTDIWEKGLAHSALAPDSPYKRELDALQKDVQSIAQTSGDPQEVVRLIERVLSAKKPRLRYPIGKGAKGLMLAKSIIPWSWIERVFTRRA